MVSSLPKKTELQKKHTPKDKVRTKLSSSWQQSQPKSQHQIRKQKYNASSHQSTLSYASLVKSKIINPSFVELIPKSLAAPEIGRSVVARANFDNGDIICSYGGDIITSAQYELLRRINKHRAPRVSYFVEIDDDLSVDGYPKLASAKGHVGNYINDARNIVGAEQNCCISLVTDPTGATVQYVVIEAIKPIKSGEELWLDYGDDYWG